MPKLNLITLTLAVSALAVPCAQGQIGLVDRTVQAGTNFTHQPYGPGIPGPQDYMAAGIAVADFNNDGWPDIFWASGGIEPDRLFINQQNGTFQNQAAAWGVGVIHCACGASAADYDNDGWVDIYVTSFGYSSNNAGQVGKNRLYRNNGNGTFTNVAVEAGVAFTSFTISSGYGSAWGDYDLDGDLDLAVMAWYSPAQGNRLFRNDGDGTFTDVTGSALVFPANTWGFQSRFADMDNDGWPELLCAADFGTSRYYKNDGDGTFTDLTQVNGTGIDQNGMGQCVGDFDNDGRLDWYVTSIYLDVPQANSGSGNMLYLNSGGHQFAESATPAEVGDGGWGWGTVAVDLDQDGWLDIVEVNGRPGNVEFTGEQEYVFRNLGDGAFEEVALTAGLTFKAEGKSCSYVDYDRDGDMDLAITFNGSLVKLYANESPDAGSWLHLTFDNGDNPLIAPNGFGARVTAIVGEQAYVRYQDGGPNFNGTSELCTHFGFGEATVVDQLIVRWPRGYVTHLENVAVDQHLVIEAPSLHDFDGSGLVDGADIAVVLGMWGNLGTSGDRRADTNNDGTVDGADIAGVLGAWGTN